MGILERALYDKFFNNSSYDIATMYLEEAFQYATEIYKDDIPNIANKINDGISFDDFMNKFNNWTKREHYKKYPTHMFGDLIL